MSQSRLAALPLALALSAALAAPAGALTVTATTDGTALLNALVPDTGAFSGIAAAHTLGAATQVGTYTGFTSPPVTFGNGIVLSTGLATQTTAANTSPSTGFGGGSTAQIDAYAPGNVANWDDSNDAAQLTLTFTLASASAIAFDFIFGSVEYPVYTSSYTDAFFAFLDGTQITFDSNGDPVQVGGSFASTLTTADTNTAFNSPHGLVGPLTTTSGTLAAGTHTLNLVVADTNDAILDSAVFLSNFRLADNTGGPVTNPGGTPTPEPAGLALLGVALAGLGALRRRR